MKQIALILSILLLFAWSSVFAVDTENTKDLRHNENAKKIQEDLGQTDGSSMNISASEVTFKIPVCHKGRVIGSLQAGQKVLYLRIRQGIAVDPHIIDEPREVIIDAADVELRHRKWRAAGEQRGRCHELAIDIDAVIRAIKGRLGAELPVCTEGNLDFIRMRI